jgi:predicted adenine nucleotide alpha hydrolase (AANH) superfamily ATPase
MSIEENIIEKVRILPPDKQQEALDFVEFLLAKMQKQELSAQKIKSGVSALALAQEYIGCVEAASDLSTNKDYMDGYGS